MSDTLTPETRHLKPEDLPILPMTEAHILRVLLGWKTSTLRPSKLPAGSYRLAVDGVSVAIVQLLPLGPVNWGQLNQAGREELADCEGGYSVAAFVRVMASWPSKRGHTPYSDFANGKRELQRHHLRVLEVLHPVLREILANHRDAVGETGNA